MNRNAASSQVMQQKVLYEKAQSFDSFVSNLDTDVDLCVKRCLNILESTDFNQFSDHKSDVLRLALQDLKEADANKERFKITVPIADELSKISDSNVCRYLFHRYRYDIFPKQKRIDDYPPYLQIEPTSVCNYRCVFCYQTDESFANKKSGHMGSMTFDMFKDIIDQVEGHVEFFSLASRGEPLICKDIDQMLEYCSGKFLGLKMNTNASLLNEKHCHAILAGGVNTLVISADAAVEPLYSQMRVNGKLDRVLKNLEMFRAIKDKHYPDSKLITRVSGVRFNSKQSMDSMTDVWGPIVDQVCFVDYNPWENVYDSPVSNVNKPCTDLWRRMFIWFNGDINPCDTDYKSTLKVGNLDGQTVSDLWRNGHYEQLRANHLNSQRLIQEPCRRCTVI